MMMKLHLRSEIRRFIGNYPKLFYSSYGLKALNRKLSVKPDTDIVIEGYPRSANTFAVLAFENMHGNHLNLKIAHHLHVPAQIYQAINFKIPLLILIRHPKDCITSLKLREPSVSIDQALRHYTSFYKIIAKNKNHCIIGNFDDVIHNYGQVIAKVNQKFGTSFVTITPTKDETKKIFDTISNINKVFSNDRELSLSAPSKKKEEAKLKIKETLNSCFYADKLSSATDYYESLTNS
ncbi:MAG: hypothetical protein VKN72_00520 [Nostocales cyanobacterium 94392]|nr:hypothetical protein [Nostocales cyanobacterium 94392]